jgi:hypothetical protein
MNYHLSTSYKSTSEDTDPRLVFSLYIVCIKVQVRTQIHVLSSLYISFVSKYKWGHRSTSFLLSIYCLYQSTSEDTDPPLSLLSIYRLYQSTSENTDTRLVFSLYIACIKVQVRTQIHVLVFSLYIVCIKVQVRTQIHVLSSLYISFVSKYKWGHRSMSCLLSIYRLY